MTHVAIIGAGIVGVSTAIWLRRDGHDVTLIDRGAPGDGTSYGNAGVLASCSIVPVTGPGLVRKAPGMLFDPKQPLFLKWGYLPKLVPWLRRYLAHANAPDTRRIAAGLALVVPDSLAEHQALAAGTGAEHFIAPSDYVFGYRDRAHYEADAFAWQLRRDHGFAWDVLEGEAARAYDPALSPDVGLLATLPDHGHIKDPGGYVKALAQYADGEGVRLVRADVETVLREGDSVAGVRAGGETITAEKVVLATGVWSKPLCAALGLNVPLESERGYHLELIAPSVIPRAPIMVAAGKFVATPMTGRLRLAGIVEFGGLDAPPSRAPFRLLERSIRQALPGLTWRDTREWMGHRPAPADSLPLIGPIPGADGAFAGFGHHHIGLTAGPKTGRLLSQIIGGRTPNVDMTAFAPARFG
ncbi:MAG: FAD-dependent oxidoreductase [Pseudomonadota bacterium]